MPGVIAQAAIYGFLAAVLIVDGIKTLMQRENVFYKNGNASPVWTGFLLIAAAGTVIMFALRTFTKTAWSRTGLWICIAAAGIMMVFMIVDQERK